MQNKVTDIKGHWTSKNNIHEAFSFAAFINYIRRHIETEPTIKSEFYRFVLNKFNKFPQLLTDNVDVNELNNYRDLFELVYTLLSPAIGDDSKFYWAISTPVPAKIIYGTDAFYELLIAHNESDTKSSEISSLFHQSQADHLYRLILQRLYKFPADLSNEIIYSITNPKTNLSKHYKIQTDSRFVDITYEGELPALNPEIIEPAIYEGAGMDMLKGILPLSMFTFTGFSVVSMRETTSERAVETIRMALMNNNESQGSLYKKVIQSLQTLSIHASIQFGLLPFIRINGKLMFDADACAHSFIIKSAKRYRASEDIFNTFIQDFINAPKAMFFSTLSNKKTEEFPMLKVLQRAGIKSFAVLPVYYNRHLTGMMEIYSNQKVIFYEKLLSRLQPAVPLISQLLMDSANSLHNEVERVIKDKFTTLQPAVEWKFNEAAWHYLKNNKGNLETDMETVSFHNVYPLYGAIDMRNSTIEHNAALKQDMATLTMLLAATVDQLKHVLPAKTSLQLTAQLKTWKRKLSDFERTHDETLLKSFLYDKVGAYLTKLKHKHIDAKQLIDNYFVEIDNTKGKVYARRGAVETSMRKINSLLTHYFEKQAARLQNIYPCYFEKFRSDGIEYDVYTGQDMAHEIPFKPLHIKKFRQWQLRSMIDVSILTRALIPKLPVPIETASLIFVHSSQIDICFRNDERRFDVEGYYNIRYEVIKKRIDKAVIKSTGERLTQPGKISIVYFNNEEIEAYVSHIKKLQRTGLLKNDLEHVTLEELQGVHNIKALRVSINYTN